MFNNFSESLCLYAITNVGGFLTFVSNNHVLESSITIFFMNQFSNLFYKIVVNKTTFKIGTCEIDPREKLK